MSCLFLILALLPFTIGKEPDGNRTELICEKSEVKVAGDKVFECYTKEVNHVLNKANPACDQLQQDLDDFVKVVNESCPLGEDRARTSRSKDFLVKLLQFSIKNSVFGDFVQSNGLKCMSSIKSKVAACINKERGVVEKRESSEYRKYNHLTRITDIPFAHETTCGVATRVKECTLRNMLHEEGHCRDPHGVQMFYVGMLFDFMLKKCIIFHEKGDHPLPPPPPGPGNDKGTRVTHALLIVLLVMGFLAMFYTCFRDCRSPRGQWKALNERISMSTINRRRSLVHNEAGRD